jgi:uncharacterized protein (TIGR00730 family)
MSTKSLKAYEDVPFLKRDEARAVRLQLEFLRPDVIMAENHVCSTIVLFGSARIPEPQRAREHLEEALRLAAAEPSSAERQASARRAARMVEISRYYDVAREFAAMVSSCCQISGRCDYVIMTGGGGGIMEAGNRGAADVGAKSIGLNISLPYEQVPNPYIPEALTFHFHYFSIRKMHFLLRAKALCAFPGGYGTLDELFETLTLIQTRKIRPIPVILFGQRFWEELINWRLLVDDGLISPEDVRIFRYCEAATEAWDFIQSFWGDRRQGDVLTGGDAKA